ncbi:MAG TPA: universal stress protein UspA [Bacteroidales bacterium]|jgi:nucleotide-binding universal stress UspA family protein|nr:universal stress protein UspA [Bacteroidales bacterium]
MNEESHIILIPWDFTPVAECALQHGFKFAEKAKSKKIVLIHIIKNEKEHDEALGKLNQVVSDNQGKHGLKIEAVVRVGSIFTTIGEVASEVEAELVVMGTHGLKGMQKLTGSWALKVIVNSKVPFVVIQEPPNETDMRDIVFPVDFKRENKEMLNWVSYLHKHFNPKFHIIKPNTTDLGFIKKIKANIAFSRKFMDSKSIDYEIHTAEGKKSFPLEIMEFGKSINADLILILSTKNIGITDFVLGAQEQYVIANSSKIPVMVINPRDDLTKMDIVY